MCFYVFIQHFSGFNGKDHSGYLNCHIARQENSYTFYNSPPLALSIPLFSLIKQLLAVSPQNSLNEDRGRRQERADGYKVERSVAHSILPMSNDLNSNSTFSLFLISIWTGGLLGL